VSRSLQVLGWQGSEPSMTLLSQYRLPLLYVCTSELIVHPLGEVYPIDPAAPPPADGSAPEIIGCHGDAWPTSEISPKPQ